MASTSTSETYSTTSDSTPSSTQASSPSAPAVDPKEVKLAQLKAFRDSPAGQKLAKIVHDAYLKAKSDRSRLQRRWWTNMSMYYGNQDLRFTSSNNAPGYDNKLILPKRPYYNRKKTINLTRGIVRTEMAKLLSQPPTTTVIPATAEDEDMRMALAAEQVVESYRSKRRLIEHMERAVWWESVTGNGFLKQWWDPNVLDVPSGQQGDVCYGSITPFHLFVPDLREQDIEDQPFVLTVQTKPMEWIKRFFGPLLDDKITNPSTVSATSIIDDAYLDIPTDDGKKKNDSCMIYEMWAKPGAFEALPDGGQVIMVDDCIVSYSDKGMPYKHGQYPYTHLQSIPTGKFYADSTLNDTNALQVEYNEIRTAISHAGRVMAKPQLLAERGSIVVSKMTNEPGAVIEYKVGRPIPVPLTLSPLPEYYVSQQDTIQSDIENVSGQHQVSKGQAPAGLTAGTAINALQERDDQYLTTTYASLERAYEKVASQTIQLFIEYVDVKRAIKTVGTDGSYDTVLLEGADLKDSTDIRVESGSTVGQSKAAKQAYLMDLFSLGAIDNTQLLEMLEIGGVEKVIDSINLAESAARLENIKMKKLDAGLVGELQQQYQLLSQDGQIPLTQTGAPMPPPLPVPVNTWDNDQVHITTHNNFRMGQEFALLPDSIKQVFEDHVQAHMAQMQANQQQQMMAQIPSDGTAPPLGGPSGGPTPGAAPQGAQPGQGPASAGGDPMAPSPSSTGPGGSVAGNGAVPSAPTSTPGGP